MVERIPHVYGYCAIHTDGGVMATIGFFMCVGMLIGFFMFPLLRRLISHLDDSGAW